MKKRIIAILCAMAMMTGLMAGCQSGTPSNSSSSSSTPSSAADKSSGGTDKAPEAPKPDMSAKVELTLGLLNAKNSEDEEVWPTTVVEEWEKAMNISLRVVGYDEERLNLDLASGQLCDIMMIYPKHLDGVLKGKHAEALDPYFDSIAKNFNSEKFQLRNNVMKKYRSNDTDKVFFTTPSANDVGTGEKSATLGLGYAVRWDLYKEIGMPPINSGDDYIDALLKMKEKYPKTKEGLPVYATSAYNDLGTHSWTMRGLLDTGYATLDGNSMYCIDVKTNEISHNAYQPTANSAFWSDMKFYNRMWNEGLLDPDCFITKGEDMSDKYAKGQYIGGITNWHYGKWNEAAVKEDPNTIKGFVILPAYMGWTNSGYRAGWADKMLFVSAHSKNKERAIITLDYMNSTEFVRLTASGVEGVNYKKDANGVPVLTEDTIDMKTNLARVDEWKKLGLGQWVNQQGHAPVSICADGAPASLWNTPELWASTLNATEKDFCKTMNVDYPAQVLENKIKEGKCIDQIDFNTVATACMPSATKDITRIDNNCLEIIINSLPNIVKAKDEAAFTAARAKLIADLKGADIETAVKWWTDNWNAAKTAVEGMGK